MTPALAATESNEVRLELNFDADQITSDLTHRLVRVSPDAPDPAPRTGSRADSMYFAPGERLSLHITGYGAASVPEAPGKEFVSFQVIDCVIVTRPQVIQRGRGLETQYAAPSPFLQAVGACYPVELDFTATAGGLLENGARSVTQSWKRTLDVGLNPGCWQLSLVLTIRIMRGQGTVHELRVLSFDPEAEVGGNGTLK